MTDGRYPISDVWFNLDGPHSYSYMNGSSFAYNYNITGNQTALSLSCCANDTENKVSCKSGSYIMVGTDICDTYIFTMEFVKLFRCIYENAFGGWF